MDFQDIEKALNPIQELLENKKDPQYSESLKKLFETIKGYYKKAFDMLLETNIIVKANFKPDQEVYWVDSDWLNLQKGTRKYTVMKGYIHTISISLYHDIQRVQYHVSPDMEYQDSVWTADRDRYDDSLFATEEEAKQEQLQRIKDREEEYGTIEREIK